MNEAMDVQGSTAQRSQWTGDGLVIGVFEGSSELTDGFADLPTEVKAALQDVISDAAFKGKAGSCAIARVGGSSPIRKVGVVGLGKPESLSLDVLRKAAGAVAQAAHRAKCKTVAVDLPIGNEDASSSAQAITEGLILALHTDLRFKSDEDAKSKDTPIVTSVDLLGFTEPSAAITRGQQICEGVILARELVSAPANVVTPVTLAETVEAIAQDYGLDLEILEQADCE
ncbi:MAG: leucyl aminopeptidase, partial [Symploca sp. SIO2B6]|nr:leucyl aminopeptidase [Symploca sp. SIO2B6]